MGPASGSSGGSGKGISVKKIKLTQNKFLIVDNDDFSWLNKIIEHKIKRKINKVIFGRR